MQVLSGKPDLKPLLDTYEEVVLCLMLEMLCVLQEAGSCSSALELQNLLVLKKLSKWDCHVLEVILRGQGQSRRSGPQTRTHAWFETSS